MKKIVLAAVLFLVVSLSGSISFAAKDKSDFQRFNNSKKKQKTETRDINIPREGVEYIDNFKRGDAQIQPYQEKPLNGIVEKMNAEPNLIIFLWGHYSAEEKIKGGVCYVNDDLTYYSLNTPREDTRKVTGEVECEELLGRARDKSVEVYLREHKISADRIKPAQRVDPGKQKSSESNRAVAYRFYDLSKGVTLLKVHENPDGSFTLTIEEPAPTRCERIKAWMERHSRRLQQKP